MSTNEGFTPSHPLPHFLSGDADEYERRGGSPLLKMSLSVIMAAVIAIAITLSLENPVKVFADVTAWLIDMSGQQGGTDQSTPAIQSTADAQDLPPTPAGAPARDEIAATSDPADQNQKDFSEAASGALLQQFQTWAAKQEERAPVEPVQPVQIARAEVGAVEPVQSAPVLVLQDDQAPARAVQKRRRVRAVQNARAEIRPVQNPRARVRRDQNPRSEARPVQDVRAQDQSGPSFLQSLGLH